MSRRPIAYFEADGSYNEREPRKKAPTQHRFALDFSKPIIEQLRGKVPECRLRDFAEMQNAVETLRGHGCLPKNRLRGVQIQIERKAESSVNRFKKNKP